MAGGSTPEPRSTVLLAAVIFLTGISATYAQPYVWDNSWPYGWVPAVEELYPPPLYNPPSGQGSYATPTPTIPSVYNTPSRGGFETTMISPACNQDMKAIWADFLKALAWAAMAIAAVIFTIILFVYRHHTRVKDYSKVRTLSGTNIAEIQWFAFVNNTYFGLLLCDGVIGLIGQALQYRSRVELSLFWISWAKYVVATSCQVALHCALFKYLLYWKCESYALGGCACFKEPSPSEQQQERVCRESHVLPLRSEIEETNRRRFYAACQFIAFGGIFAGLSYGFFVVMQPMFITSHGCSNRIRLGSIYAVEALALSSYVVTSLLQVFKRSVVLLEPSYSGWRMYSVPISFIRLCFLVIREVAIVTLEVVSLVGLMASNVGRATFWMPWASALLTSLTSVWLNWHALEIFDGHL